MLSVIIEGVCQAPRTLDLLQRAVDIVAAGSLSAIAQGPSCDGPKWAVLDRADQWLGVERDT